MVMIVVMVAVRVSVLVHGSGNRIFTAHTELRGAHAGTKHLLRPD